MAFFAATCVLLLANVLVQTDDLQPSSAGDHALSPVESKDSKPKLPKASKSLNPRQRQPSRQELEKFIKAKSALRNDPLLAIELAGQLASLKDPLPDPLLGYVLWIQGSSLSLVERHPEALEVLTRAEAIARRIKDDRLLRRVLRYKAASAFECAAYSAGRDAAEEAIQISDRLGDQSSYVARLYSELAANESAMGDNQAAVESVLKAVDLAERSGDRKTQSQIMVNAASVMLDLEQHQTAVETFRRVLKLEGEDAKNLVVVAALRGLGDAEVALNNFDAAEEQLLKALKLSTIPGAARMSADINFSLGKLSVAQGRHDEAREYLSIAQQAFRDLEQHDDAQFVQQLLHAIDEPLNVDKRLGLIKSNLSNAERSGDIELQATLHRQLAAAFKDAGDLRQSAIHSQKADLLEKKLKGLGLNDQIVARLSEFSLKQKLKIIDELESEVSARNALLEAQRRWNTGLVICIILILFVASVIAGLLIRYRRALHEVRVAKELLRKQKQLQFEIERRLAEQQKSESLAVMASGIAHDFNNLLAGIAGLSELAVVSSSNTRKDELLGQITGASMHASTLTGQLMQFLGKPRTDSTSCDVAEVLRCHTELLQSVARPNQLDVTADAESVMAVIDDNRLCQVLVNLVSNASEASSPDQSISIHLDVVNVSELDATAVADGTAEPGDYCRVQVRDSGSGMSEETKARLFDPYFTTKTMGRGLGLSSVIGIVRSRDGFVEVQSQPGQGCCFAVYLKLARHVAVSDSSEGSIVAQAPKRIKRESKAAPQVLLVDDEQMLLDMQTQYLSLSGMGVLTAKSAEEGLEVANTNFSTLDCVVTDFCMSGKDGHWLAEQLRMKHPHIPVILCSGLVDGSLEAESELYSVLAKPFSCKTLEALIRERVSQTNQRQQSAHDLAS